MGNVFATLAFKVFETMWAVYARTHGKKEKSKVERDLEALLKKQNKLIEDAKKYCAYIEDKLRSTEAKLREAEENSARKDALVEKLTGPRPLDPNPY